MRIGSLFSGIGGLELGLEWAGLGPVVWQCEIDPFNRAVLEKHWPNVTRFVDVTQPRHYPDVDLICGGFPCQDVSQAGGGHKGLAGARSGLWYHFADVIAKARPPWVLIENVASGKQRWLPAVRRQMHLLGYRTRALGIAARDVGAPHMRRRVFVVAHSDGDRKPGVSFDAEVERLPQPVGHTVRVGRSRAEGQDDHRRPEPAAGSGWAPEPAVRRVVDGLPGGMDGRRRRAQVRAFGNAVVPQCAEVAGRVILEMAKCSPCARETINKTGETK